MAASYDNEEKGLPHQRSALTSVLSSIRFIKSVFSKGQTTASQYPPLSQPPVASTLDGTTAAMNRASYNFEAPLVEAPLATLPAHDKLATYRRITGITSAREHKSGHRPAINLGIYARVVKNERNASDAYKFSSRLISASLSLQLIVAATLTALGAGNGPHAAVTVFGAINTITAGFLTYLKGSGLPNRHKICASSWGKVREYMEQREREFERADCALDVEEVLRKVEHMYEEVRQDVAANEPETYMSTGLIKKSEGVVPGPEIADRRGEMSYIPNYAATAIPAAATAWDRLQAAGKSKMQTLGAELHDGFESNKAAADGRAQSWEDKIYDFGREKLADELGLRKADPGIPPHVQVQVQDYEPWSRVHYPENQGRGSGDGAGVPPPSQKTEPSQHAPTTQTPQAAPRPAEGEAVTRSQSPHPQPHEGK